MMMDCWTGGSTSMDCWTGGSTSMNCWTKDNWVALVKLRALNRGTKSNVTVVWGTSCFVLKLMLLCATVRNSWILPVIVFWKTARCELLHSENRTVRDTVWRKVHGARYCIEITVRCELYSDNRTVRVTAFWTSHSARYCMEKSARCEILYSDNRTVQQDTVLK